MNDASRPCGITSGLRFVPASAGSGAAGDDKAQQHVGGKRGQAQGLGEVGDGVGTDAAAEVGDVGVVVGRHAQVQTRVLARARQVSGRRAHAGIVLDLVGERPRGGVAVDVGGAGGGVG